MTKTDWKSSNEPVPMGALVLAHSRVTGSTEVCRMTHEGLKMRGCTPFRHMTDWHALVLPDETT